MAQGAPDRPDSASLPHLARGKGSTVPPSTRGWREGPTPAGPPGCGCPHLGAAPSLGSGSHPKPLLGSGSQTVQLGRLLGLSSSAAAPTARGWETGRVTGPRDIMSQHTGTCLLPENASLQVRSFLPGPGPADLRCPSHSALLELRALPCPQGVLPFGETQGVECF